MEITNNTYSGAKTRQSLRELYGSFGYTRFKMSKFEEYDTYAQIKDFLLSDRVITFTDTNGKLLAMKPDVTVSIIKNSDDGAQGVQKVYYNENVYRVSDGSHAFKEIMQAGLECIGDVDIYHICEVILLAAMSLQTISERFVLDISHVGFVSSLLKKANFTAEETTKALNYISEKNKPELMALCENKALSQEFTEKILNLVTLYGTLDQVLPQLSAMCETEEMTQAVTDLQSILSVLERLGLADRVQLDFSVINDMNYYNGFLFRGYIEGIPTGVLGGGQYDKLMEKMGKHQKAIGFAVYLDLLEQLEKRNDDYDADVLLLYDDQTAPETVMARVFGLKIQGKTVLAQKMQTDKHCKEVIDLREEK